MRILGYRTDPIATALLLAAGTGSRLQPLTDDAPKCLTEVNGTTMLERLVHGLRAWEFERLVVVVGHLERRVRDFLVDAAQGLSLEFIHSTRYRTTNNIYSLWAARQAMQEPFLLLECDLIFDNVLLGGMLEPDRIAVAPALPWMNGTMVSLDPSRRVTGFHIGPDDAAEQFTHKTVNMYSFSQPTWQRVSQRLEQHISSGRVNEYYETVFAEMVADGSLSLDAVNFDDQRWYEVDTLHDLRAAEKMFPRNGSRQLSGETGRRP